MSSGGLVAGLEGVKKKLPFIWIGWPGKYVEEDQQEAFSEQLMKEQKCIPVFLEDELADQHYNGTLSPPSSSSSPSAFYLK